MTAGQALFVLQYPDTEYAAAAAALAKIAGLKARLNGQAFDAASTRDLPLTWQELEGALAQLREAQAQQAQMTIRAPFAGRLVDVPRDLAPGVWLPKHEQLGILVDPSASVVEALVNESDIARIRVGDAAWFFPENGEAPLPARVSEISPGATTRLDTPELASVYGGGIAARREPDGVLKPQSAVYRVVLRLRDGVSGALGIRRGAVRIAAEPVSLADRIWRRAVDVVMREAGL